MNFDPRAREAEPTARRVRAVVDGLTAGRGGGAGVFILHRRAFAAREMGVREAGCDRGGRGGGADGEVVGRQVCAGGVSFQRNFTFTDLASLEPRRTTWFAVAI